MAAMFKCPGPRQLVADARRSRWKHSPLPSTARSTGDKERKRERETDEWVPLAHNEPSSPIFCGILPSDPFLIQNGLEGCVKLRGENFDF